MLVKNNTRRKIVAFGWHTKGGLGDDVHINPGETIEVNGPYLGEVNGEKSFASLRGKIICQNAPNGTDNLLIVSNALSATEQENAIGITMQFYPTE